MRGATLLENDMFLQYNVRYSYRWSHFKSEISCQNSLDFLGRLIQHSTINTFFSYC